MDAHDAAQSSTQPSAYPSPPLTVTRDEEHTDAVVTNVDRNTYTDVDTNDAQSHATHASPAHVRVLRRPAALLATSAAHSMRNNNNNKQDFMCGSANYSQGCWKSVPVHARTTRLWSGGRQGESSTANNSSSSHSSSSNNKISANDRSNGSNDHRDSSSNKDDPGDSSDSLGSGTTSSSLNSATCSATQHSGSTSKNMTNSEEPDSRMQKARDGSDTSAGKAAVSTSSGVFLDARDGSAVVHYRKHNEDAQGPSSLANNANSNNNHDDHINKQQQRDHVDDPFLPYACPEGDHSSPNDSHPHHHRHRHRHNGNNNHPHRRRRHGEHAHQSQRCLRAWDSYPGCTGRVMSLRSTQPIASSHDPRQPIHADSALARDAQDSNSNYAYAVNQVEAGQRGSPRAWVNTGTQQRTEQDIRGQARLRASASPLDLSYRRPILLPVVSSPASSAGQNPAANAPAHLNSNTNNNTSPAHMLLQQQLHHSFLPMAQVSSQRGHAVDHVRVEQLAHRMQSMRGIVSVMTSGELPDKFYMNMLSFLMFAQEIVRQQRVMMVGPVACYLNLRTRTFIVADFIPTKPTEKGSGDAGESKEKSSQRQDGVSTDDHASSGNNTDSNAGDSATRAGNDTLLPRGKSVNSDRAHTADPEQAKHEQVEDDNAKISDDGAGVDSAHVTTPSQHESGTTHHNNTQHDGDSNHPHDNDNTASSASVQKNDNSNSTRALQTTMDALQAAYATENREEENAVLTNSIRSGVSSNDINNNSSGAHGSHRRHRDKTAVHSASEVCPHHACTNDSQHTTTQAMRRSEFHRLPAATSTAAARSGISGKNNNSNTSAHSGEYQSMPLLYQSDTTTVADQNNNNNNKKDGNIGNVNDKISRTASPNDAELNLDYFLSEDMIAHLRACDGVLHFYRRGTASVAFPFITRERLVMLKKMSAVRLSSIKGLSVFGVLLANTLTEEAVASGETAEGHTKQSIIPLQYDVDPAPFEKVTETKQSAEIPPAVSPLTQTAAGTGADGSSGAAAAGSGGGGDATATVVIDVPTLQTEANVTPTMPAAAAAMNDVHTKYPTTTSHSSSSSSSNDAKGTNHATDNMSNRQDGKDDSGAVSAIKHGENANSADGDGATKTYDGADHAPDKKEQEGTPGTAKVQLGVPGAVRDDTRAGEEAEMNSEMQLPRILTHRAGAGGGGHVSTHHHQHDSHSHTHASRRQRKGDKESSHDMHHTTAAAAERSSSRVPKAVRTELPKSATGTPYSIPTPTTTTLFSGYTVPSSASAALDGYSTALKFLQSYNSATLYEQQQGHGQTDKVESTNRTNGNTSDDDRRVDEAEKEKVAQRREGNEEKDDKGKDGKGFVKSVEARGDGAVEMFSLSSAPREAGGEDAHKLLASGAHTDKNDAGVPSRNENKSAVDREAEQTPPHAATTIIVQSMKDRDAEDAQHPVVNINHDINNNNASDNNVSHPNAHSSTSSNVEWPKPTQRDKRAIDEDENNRNFGDSLVDFTRANVLGDGDSNNMFDMQNNNNNKNITTTNNNDNTNNIINNKDANNSEDSSGRNRVTDNNNNRVDRVEADGDVDDNLRSVMRRQRLHILVYTRTFRVDIEQEVCRFGHCVTFVTTPQQMLCYQGVGLQLFNLIVIEWCRELVTPEVQTELLRRTLKETMVICHVLTKPAVSLSLSESKPATVHAEQQKADGNANQNSRSANNSTTEAAGQEVFDIPAHLVSSEITVLRNDDMAKTVLESCQFNKIHALARQRYLLSQLQHVQTHRSYQIVQQIGSGAFGDVYEVFMHASKGRLAMKRVLLKNATLRILELLYREVQVISAISHPNIVTFSHILLDKSACSIFMELCDGSLSQRIENPTTTVAWSTRQGNTSFMQYAETSSHPASGLSSASSSSTSLSPTHVPSDDKTRRRTGSLAEQHAPDVLVEHTSASPAQKRPEDRGRQSHATVPRKDHDAAGMVQSTDTRDGHTNTEEGDGDERTATDDTRAGADADKDSSTASESRSGSDSGSSSSSMSTTASRAHGSSSNSSSSPDGKHHLMRISAREAVLIIHDVASGLAYLHSKDIIHRDIKPDNILFVDGAAKIADFGSSVRVNEHHPLTMMNGTLAYMSPEVVLGEPYGKSCDMWSFGCVIADIMGMDLGHLHGLHVPALIELYHFIPKEASLPVTMGTRTRPRFENHYSNHVTHDVLRSLHTALSVAQREQQQAASETGSELTAPPPSRNSANNDSAPGSRHRSNSRSSAIDSESNNDTTAGDRASVTRTTGSLSSLVGAAGLSTTGGGVREATSCPIGERTVTCIKVGSTSVKEIHGTLSISVVQLFEDLFRRDPASRMTITELLEHPVAWNVDWMASAMEAVRALRQRVHQEANAADDKQAAEAQTNSLTFSETDELAATNAGARTTTSTHKSQQTFLTAPTSALSDATTTTTTTSQGNTTLLPPLP